MKILFVRHAKAMEKAEFIGSDDLERPLTEDGRAAAKKAFKRFAKAYPCPEVLLTSRATRAKDTALELAAAFQHVEIREVEELNPGCSPTRFRKMVRSLAEKLERIAVVGHDPDFTDIIADLVSDGSLGVEVKKGSCIEVDWNPDEERGVLTLLAPPAFLRAL